MEVHLIDPEEGFPRENKNQVRVLTLPDPKDSRKFVTNVMCRYCLEGGEVLFQKNPYDSDESFEDALNWAKAFARVHGIADVYAANFCSQFVKPLGAVKRDSRRCSVNCDLNKVAVCA